jgi:allophanate hydrolase
MPPSSDDSFDFRALAARYQNGQTTPSAVIAEVMNRIANHNDPALFIHLFSKADIAVQIDRIEAARDRGQSMPLYGLPFAIKDNIHVVGHPTTAGCPDFSFTPDRSATVVERLCAAGAILIGKTNLDQFATGLVGTRSPYGTPRNPFGEQYIPGGSSSGSAVAVAAGLVSFALGTDTAGSGRVPAAFNNIVGLKPTRGRISAAGVVPACQSLDCVSVFALTCDDAAAVLQVCEGYDPLDPFSRTKEDWPAVSPADPRHFRFGIPRADQFRFFGDRDMPALFAAAASRLKELGGTKVEFDFAPFAQAARLLYEGPWLAERYAAIKDFITRKPDSLLELTRSIISKGSGIDAASAFEGLYTLNAIRQQTRPTWNEVDFLLLPTAATIYTRAQIAADPIQFNTNLGYYTNFTNLLDLCALAVPAGFSQTGMPAGVTLFSQAGCDSTLLDLGARFQKVTDLSLGATGHPLPVAGEPPSNSVLEGWVQVAVLGAHLSGLPLNWQLTERKARQIRTCRTAPDYRFYALPGTVPAKPGLVRVKAGTGAHIELEIWAMTAQHFGTFVASIPPPLGIGTILLEDGTEVKGFLCEPFVLAGAKDISEFGGWRGYLQSQR